MLFDQYVHAYTYQYIYGVCVLSYRECMLSYRIIFILQDSTEREEENELTIERILIFIRNVLQVPPNDNDKRGDNDATVHDEVRIIILK